MTNFLKTVLNIDEPIFSVGMKALEKSTGNCGIDVRLIADIHENAHKVMRALKLKTNDTTGHELYHSLISAVKNSDIESLLIDTDYTLYVTENKIISLNLIDVIENSHHELPYENQVIGHGQRSLRGEIIGRYVQHVRTDEKSTLEMVSSIGLLPESDAWYNNAKANKKQKTK